MKGIPYAAQVELGLSYKGNPLKSKFIPDFICHEKIILEIKAVSVLTDQHRAQVHNYLKATGMKLGILVNFGSHQIFSTSASFEPRVESYPHD